MRAAPSFLGLFVPRASPIASPRWWPARFLPRVFRPARPILLKTAAAKRRNLLAAVEAIRADDVPDELQAQQIQWLEQALAELEGK
jgi:hypothetical protein